MTRFGPLQSLTPALIVGDPTRRHLSLESEGIRYIVEGRMVETYQWQELNRIDTNFPCTWFRYPGAIAGLAMSLIALLTHDTPDFRAKPGNAKVTHDGKEQHLQIDTHHLIGYWRGAVTATQRLLDQLVLDAPSRVLLNDPDALVKTVAASKKWYR